MLVTGVPMFGKFPERDFPGGGPRGHQEPGRPHAGQEGVGRVHAEIRRRRDGRGGVPEDGRRDSPGLY
eukprot:710707-Heterocapsa_arctica.AAC.1